MEETEFYLEDLKSKFAKIDTSKYYLCYSGGRDSHFVLWFIKEILKDNKIKIVSVNTLLEHKEIKERMLKNADVILLPSKRHKDIKIEFGIPCFSKCQDEFIKRYQNGSRTINTLKYVEGNTKSWYKLNNTARKLLLDNKLHKVSNLCCKYLKKDPLKKFQKENKLFPIICTRSSEGVFRSNIKSCLHKDKSFTPIYDLNDDLLKKLELQFNIEVPKVYDVLERTGCFGCPYGRNIQKELNLLDDSQKNFVIDYFKESYIVKKICHN